MSGFSDWLGKKQPDGTTSLLGGALSYDPKADIGRTDRLGLFGSTLKDISASLGGHPEDAQNVAMFDKGQKQATALAAKTAAKAALTQALSTGDTGKIQQAAIAYTAAGGDLSGFATAMKFAQPSIEHYSADDATYSNNPITGARTMLSGGVPKPIITGGTVSLDNARTWNKIPGYIEQQSAIYNARDLAAAQHRAPPRGTTQKPGDPVNLPHPGSLY